MSELIKQQNDEIRKETGMVKEGKLTEMDQPFYKITYKDAAGRKKTDSMRAKNSNEARKDFVKMNKGRGFKVLSAIKEGKLNEVDFSKIKLPSSINRFLTRLVDSVKDAQLNRIKRSALLYKVIDAMGMSPQQLMADIAKIKKELK